MSPEALERLLIDREVGTLPPDAAELLAAYLEQSDPDTRLVDRTHETVALARAALRDQVPFSLPAFPVEGLERVSRRRRRVRRLSYAGGMAACLMLGLGIGRFAIRPAAPGAMDGPKLVVIEVPTETKAATRANASDFWSVEKWIERVEQRQPSRRSEKLIWDSPVSRPRLRGET